MDTQEFKTGIKTASAYLAEHGISVPHTRLLEAMSRAFGERNWSTLNARQRRAETEARRAKAPTVVQPPQEIPFIVGTDNLLPGHRLVDEVPCSMFGGTRKSCLYDAMRVMGVPAIYWHPIVELVQEHGGFSEPAQRPVCPNDDVRHGDDTAACNRFGQTRVQVLLAALQQTRLMGGEVEGLVAEYRARGGLRPSWKT